MRVLIREGVIKLRVNGDSVIVRMIMRTSGYRIGGEKEKLRRVRLFPKVLVGHSVLVPIMLLISRLFNIADRVSFLSANWAYEDSKIKIKKKKRNRRIGG